MFSYMTGAIIRLIYFLAKDPTFLLLNYLTTHQKRKQQTSPYYICIANVKGRGGPKTVEPSKMANVCNRINHRNTKYWFSCINVHCENVK